MPRFAANLSMMFTEVPFLDRFELAARAGFRGVEFLFPYEFDAADIRSRLDGNGLQMVLFNMPAGDWNAGDRGMACDPARVGEFRDGMTRALRYAEALGVPQVHCMAGKVPSGVPREQALDTFVSNLRHAAGQAASAGLGVLIEPINTYDIPGYAINTSRDGIDVIDRVGAANLKLQYDLYHMQRMEGEIAETMRRLLPRIGHLQLADNPGRNEPGTGEMNYPFLFRWIDDIGYTGWIGCEYKPKTTTAAGLGWLHEMNTGVSAR